MFINRRCDHIQRWNLNIGGSISLRNQKGVWWKRHHFWKKGEQRAKHLNQFLECKDWFQVINIYSLIIRDIIKKKSQLLLHSPKTLVRLERRIEILIQTIVYFVALWAQSVWFPVIIEAMGNKLWWMWIDYGRKKP